MTQMFLGCFPRSRLRRNKHLRINVADYFIVLRRRASAPLLSMAVVCLWLLVVCLSLLIVCLSLSDYLSHESWASSARTISVTVAK